MSTAAEVIKKVRSGVVRLAFYQGRDQVGVGSAFLASNRLITNSHLLRGGTFDTVEITFGEDDHPSAPVKLAKEDLLECIQGESFEGDKDYAYLDMSKEPEFADRFSFELSSADDITRLGDQVLFFGFPFGSEVLTSHLGYISADYRDSRVHLLQIDGSINPGNSGGPLFHLISGKVVGIVTRTHTGLEKDFDELVTELEKSERFLSRLTAGVPTDQFFITTFKNTLASLRHVARNLKRSANVGIGWAFCCEHVMEDMGLVKQ